jgi:hypothetical protein
MWGPHVGVFFYLRPAEPSPSAAASPSIPQQPAISESNCLRGNHLLLILSLSPKVSEINFARINRIEFVFEFISPN